MFVWVAWNPWPWIPNCSCSFGPIEYRGALVASYLQQFLERMLNPLTYLPNQGALLDFLATTEVRHQMCAVSPSSYHGITLFTFSYFSKSILVEAVHARICWFHHTFCQLKRWVKLYFVMLPERVMSGSGLFAQNSRLMSNWCVSTFVVWSAPRRHSNLFSKSLKRVELGTWNLIGLTLCPLYWTTLRCYLGSTWQCRCCRFIY